MLHLVSFHTSCFFSQFLLHQAIYKSKWLVIFEGLPHGYLGCRGEFGSRRQKITQSNQKGKHMESTESRLDTKFHDLFPSIYNIYIYIPTPQNTSFTVEGVCFINFFWRNIPSVCIGDDSQALRSYIYPETKNPKKNLLPRKLRDGT